MLIRIPRGWELPASAATPETVWRQRRSLLKGLAAGPILAAALPTLAACDEKSGDKTKAQAAGDPTADLYPVKHNDRYM
mgnify:CR=1 FL=1